jgi:hypothetical protein
MCSVLPHECLDAKGIQQDLNGAALTRISSIFQSFLARLTVPQGIRDDWKNLVIRHRVADMAVFVTTIPQFMVPLYGTHTFGFNFGTLFTILYAGIGVLAFPFQLRWGRRQIIARIFMISGGTARLVAAFYKHNQTTAGVFIDAVPLTLVISGLVFYGKLLSDDLHEASMRSLRDRYKELDLSTPFSVVNLFDEEIDVGELAAIAAKIDKSNFRPLILHFRLRKIYGLADNSLVKIDWKQARLKCHKSTFGRLFISFIQNKIDEQNMTCICDPDEHSDFSIIGCSLTGYDFIVCGQYLDSEENRIDYSKDLLFKLTKISFFNNHKINITDLDLISLKMEPERIPFGANKDPLSFQLQVEVRFQWDKHIARLNEIRREELQTMHSIDGNNETLH